MKLAAIDIGSNSLKLVVVQAENSDSFTVLAQEREVVRLGQETLVNGHINSAATLREPASHFDMVRCGVAVYGLKDGGSVTSYAYAGAWSWPAP